MSPIKARMKSRRHAVDTRLESECYGKTRQQVSYHVWMVTQDQVWWKVGHQVWRVMDQVMDQFMDEIREE